MQLTLCKMNFTNVKKNPLAVSYNSLPLTLVNGNELYHNKS